MHIKTEFWDMKADFSFCAKKPKSQQNNKTQMQTRKPSNITFKGQIAILKHLLKNSQYK